MHTCSLRCTLTSALSRDACKRARGRRLCVCVCVSVGAVAAVEHCGWGHRPVCKQASEEYDEEVVRVPEHVELCHANLRRMYSHVRLYVVLHLYMCVRLYVVYMLHAPFVFQSTSSAATRAL